MICLILAAISFVYAFTLDSNRKYSSSESLREHMINVTIDFALFAYKELVIEVVLVSLVYYVWLK